MDRTAATALMTSSEPQVMGLQLMENGNAPDWVHLLPASPFTGRDGRGPYRVEDAAEVFAASLEAADGRLPIDKDHALDRLVDAAPAMGWIVELASRSDGVWGRVEWTDEGRRLVEGRYYRGLSPVFHHAADGRIGIVARAALTNRPNLRLTALHHQRTAPMEQLLASLQAALGLRADATEEAIVAKARELSGAPDVALQAALRPIAKAAGLAEDADQAAVLTAVQALNAGKDAEVVALQSEVTTLAGELKELKDSAARDRATTAVDAAIAAGKPGVKPRRDQYIARHMIDPAGVQADLDALPSLGGRVLPGPAPAKDKDGNVALHAEQSAVAKALGIPLEDYRKTLAAEANEEAGQ